MYQYEVTLILEREERYRVSCNRLLKQQEIVDLFYERYGEFDEDGSLIGDVTFPEVFSKADLTELFPGLGVMRIATSEVGGEISDIQGPLADDASFNDSDAAD